MAEGRHVISRIGQTLVVTLEGAADAGAAPIPALAQPALLAPASEAPPQTAGAVRTDDVLPAYRSRAPPAAST